MAADDPLRFGLVEVRIGQRQLLVDGKLVPIGARAFDVLALLVERRGRVVSKHELMDLVWAGVFVEENNLQVQISALRKRLGMHAIVTIPGRGYQFTLEPDSRPTQSASIEVSPRVRHGNLPDALPDFSLSEATGIRQRLAAILAADATGYSRLMAADERSTMAALDAARAVFRGRIEAHQGRLIDMAGDSVLAVFETAIGAVNSALAVQEALSIADSAVAEDRRMRFRIGVHLGDVIEKTDGTVYGDGVNIAARLEGMAEPGGIAVSEAVHGSLRGKVSANFEDQGEQRLKNILEPVRWYHLRAFDAATEAPTSVVAPAAKRTPAMVSNKPSIAVLPLTNMSGDPKQEYLADGISEDLTTALSRFGWLFVIARNSAFTYKGRAVDVRQVGRELGVQYILEGSVRRAGDRVRISAQLVDAIADGCIWAEQFDRKTADIFELQDDIVGRIAATVAPEITSAQIERARTKRPNTLNAWDHYLRALAAYHRITEEDIKAAIPLLEQAIDLEPEFANAYALLAQCHLKMGQHGWVKPVRQAYETSRRIAEKAVRVGPSSAEAHQALALVLILVGEAERAITVSRRAIELNPNYAEGQMVLGLALVFCGDLEGCLTACHQAQRSNPRDSRASSRLYDAMGHAYFMLGDYETAIEVSKKGLNEAPSLYGALVTLACSCAQLGRKDEARRYVDELLRLIPRYTLRALRRHPLFVNRELIERLVDSMRLAGLPE
uniref:Guanylyl cyclase n=1 Tax=uncultured bacterium 8 TaxID=1136413 RepID=A0A0U3TTD5_9BACT|nr:guanylyl cyclase [uncultured bacterium 8]